MFAHGELGPNKGVPITVAPGEVGVETSRWEGKVALQGIKTSYVPLRMEIYSFLGGRGYVIFAGNMTFEALCQRSISVSHSCPQVCVMFAAVSFNKLQHKDSSTMGS